MHFSYQTGFYIHYSVFYAKHLIIISRKYNLPLWCSSPCIYVWIFVWFISKWRCICAVRSQGNRKGLFTSTFSSSGESLFNARVPQGLQVLKKRPVSWMFALACWLAQCKMENMHSGAGRHSTSVQPLHATATDSVCALKLIFKFQSSFEHTSWILASSLELTWTEMERVLILRYFLCLCRWTNSSAVSWEKVLRLCMI